MHVPEGMSDFHPHKQHHVSVSASKNANTASSRLQIATTVQVSVSACTGLEVTNSAGLASCRPMRMLQARDGAENLLLGSRDAFTATPTYILAFCTTATFYDSQ